MKRRNFLALTAGVPLTACAASIDEVSWVEEVKLHNEKSIDVSRRASRRHSGFPSALRGPVIDYALSYQETRWSGPWYRTPASFDLFDSVPHLAVFVGDLTCNSKPDEAYGALFYRFESGAWIEVPQKAFPTAFALMNLVEDFWGQTAESDPRGRLLWEKKAGMGDFDAAHPYTIDAFFNKFSNRTCRWLRRM